MLCNCSIVSPWPSVSLVWRAMSSSRWHQTRKGCVSSTWYPQPVVLQLCSMYTLSEGEHWKVLGIVRENATNLGGDPNYFPPESAYGAWSQMKHSLPHILSVLTLRAFLNFWVCPWNSWFCHCIVTTAVQFSREVPSFVVTQCVLLASHQHTHSSQFFVHQTPVVHADLMSFVLTVAAKGHQGD